jgi:hypothetical protein
MTNEFTINFEYCGVEPNVNLPASLSPGILFDLLVLEEGKVGEQPLQSMSEKHCVLDILQRELGLQKLLQLYLLVNGKSTV